VVLFAIYTQKHSKLYYPTHGQGINIIGFEDASSKSMAHGGIEPTTFALLARRSNQLS
jgi:hypothetical protein